MNFFKLWVLLFFVVTILPCNAVADCGSYIYISSGSSNPSSDPDPPVNSSISLPDFVIKKIWLTDTADNAKTVFVPGETIRIHVKEKNVGVSSSVGIDVRYFLSNGYKKDSNPKDLGRTHIGISDLGGGQTQGLSKDVTAPTVIGTYNMTAKADPSDYVSESNEKNNWSDTAVFTITPPNYTPVGSLEIAACDVAQGWTSDQNVPNSPINVNIYSGDANGNNQVFAATVSANIYQNSVVGYHGFSWVVPDALKTGSPFTLFFYAINVPAGNNPLIGQTQLICVGSWFVPILNFILN